MELMPWNTPENPWSREAPLAKNETPSPIFSVDFGSIWKVFLLQRFFKMALTCHFLSSIILNKVLINFSLQSLFFRVHLRAVPKKTYTKISVHRNRDKNSRNWLNTILVAFKCMLLDSSAYKLHQGQFLDLRTQSFFQKLNSSNGGRFQNLSRKSWVLVRWSAF